MRDLRRNRTCRPVVSLLLCFVLVLVIPSAASMPTRSSQDLKSSPEKINQVILSNLPSSSSNDNLLDVVSQLPVELKRLVRKQFVQIRVRETKERLIREWSPFVYKGELKMLLETEDITKGWWRHFLMLSQEYDDFVAFYEKKCLLPDKPLVLTEGEHVPLLTNWFRYAAVKRYDFEHRVESPIVDVTLALQCACIQKCYHLQNGAIISGHLPQELLPLVVDQVDNYLSCN